MRHAILFRVKIPNLKGEKTLVSSKLLTLYGTPASISEAQARLENLPQVRRADAGAAAGEIRLLLCGPLPERELLALLAPSGICGFRIHI